MYFLYICFVHLLAKGCVFIYNCMINGIKISEVRKCNGYKLEFKTVFTLIFALRY